MRTKCSSTDCTFHSVTFFTSREKAELGWIISVEMFFRACRISGTYTVARCNACQILSYRKKLSQVFRGHDSVVIRQPVLFVQHFEVSAYSVRNIATKMEKFRARLGHQSVLLVVISASPFYPTIGII